MKHFICSTCGGRRYRLVVRRRNVKLEDGRKVTRLRRVCERCRPGRLYPPLCAACRRLKRAGCRRCLAARAAVADGTDEARDTFAALWGNWSPCGGGRNR